MNIITKVKMIITTLALIGMFTGYFSGNGYIGAFSTGVFLFAAISISHDFFNHSLDCSSFAGTVQ